MKISKRETKVKTKVKEEKLANQIGKVAIGVLTGIFAVFILITVLLTGNALTSLTDENLTSYAKNTAQQVESILKNAKLATSDMEAYLQKAYDMSGKGYTNMAGDKVGVGEGSKFNSIIYGNEISQMSSDVEKYMIETARNAATKNEDISGVTVMFEPGKFDEAIDSYAFYVPETIGEDEAIEPFGEYDTYSGQV